MTLGALWVLSAVALTPQPDPLNETFGDAVMRTRHFEFQYFKAHDKVTRRLAANAEAVRIRLCELIDPCYEGLITVRIARDQDEFLALQPYRAHIDWASGVAYEEFSLVILRIDKQMLLDIDQTFEHEVSHILLLKATKSRPPRWFIEGLAINQADQDLVQRFEAVAASTVSSGPIPFSQLEKSFPENESARNLAYAQSGLFVSYLRSQFGDDRLKEVISAQSYGMSFEESVEKVFGKNLAALEKAWRARLGSWGWVYTIAGDWMIWTLLTLFFLIVVVVKLKRASRRMRQMEQEEADWEYRQTGVPPVTGKRVLH